MAINRIYVEKRPEHAVEAGSVLSDLRNVQGISTLRGVRIFNRYDVEGLTDAEFASAVRNVLSEPQLDNTYEHLPPRTKGERTLAVEYLPGQFDQRADSAAQCIQFQTCGERPTVRTAKVYLFDGEITDEQMASIRRTLINPVEAREASLDRPTTLQVDYDIPTTVQTLDGLYGPGRGGSCGLCARLRSGHGRGRHRLLPGLFPRRGEARPHHHRDPHDRHLLVGPLPPHHLPYRDRRRGHRPSGGSGRLSSATSSCAERLCGASGQAHDAHGHRDHRRQGAQGARACCRTWTRARRSTPAPCKHPRGRGRPDAGLAPDVQERDAQPPHRDRALRRRGDLPGRRDPRPALRPHRTSTRPCASPAPATRPSPSPRRCEGKLPQRKLTTTAAAGYSSYGNQIGLATGCVQEIYHPGYVAKRLEIGAVRGRGARMPTCAASARAPATW